MKIRNIAFTAFWVLALFAGCTTSRPGTTTDRKEIPSPDSDGIVVVIQDPRSLADFLIQVPGIFFEGNSVRIRGSSGPPLFVVDGIRLGRSYVDANNTVNVNDIEYVEVLKSATETSRYGLQGGNGVILIRTYH